MTSLGAVEKPRFAGLVWLLHSYPGKKKRKSVNLFVETAGLFFTGQLLRQISSKPCSLWAGLFLGVQLILPKLQAKD